MRQQIFILGTERSGSTWVANIFDADPNVELIMEPFADYAHLFPGFPGRFCRVKHPDPDLIDLVRTRWAGLSGTKYALSYRPGRPRILKAVDRQVSSMFHRMAYRTGMAPPRWLLQHELLNLNQAAVRVSQHPLKHAALATQVTKELRLNFKSTILTSAFPSARVIVPLRHPVLQVASILGLMGRGRLSELRRDMAGFRTMLRNSVDMQAHWDFASRQANDSGSCSAELLTCWWITSHATLISDLRESGTPYELAWNEELSRSPLTQQQRLFEFAGVPSSRAARRYAEASSRGDAESRSAVSTRRDSSTHVARSLAAVPNETRATISGIVRDAITEGLLDGKLAPPPIEPEGPSGLAHDRC